MGDANRVRLSFYEESVWGTTPATSDYQTLRWTGESLGYNIENINSEEVRSDRQISDLIQVGAENAGGFDFELSYGSFDELLAGALFEEWGTTVAISETTIQATASGFSSTATGVFNGVVAGQWLEVSGFSDAGLNTFHQVASLSSTNSVITTVTAPSTTEAAGATVAMGGAILRNGTTMKSYSIMREHLDMSPLVYFMFRGMVVSQVEMSVEANSILTGSFEFMGKNASISSAIFTSGSIVSATTTDVMNAVSNVGTILENDSAVSSALLKSINFTMGNALRGKPAIGVLGNSSLGAGRISVNGTMEAYFLTQDLYDKYVAGTESSLSFKVTKNSQSYMITFPRIKYTEDTVNAEGNDTDVMEAIGFQAIRDATYGCTIQIDRFA